MVEARRIMSGEIPAKRYTSIEDLLSDIENDLSSMMVAAQDAVARAGTRVIGELIDSKQPISEVSLDPTPYFLPGE